MANYLEFLIITIKRICDVEKIGDYFIAKLFNGLFKYVYLLFVGSFRY